MNEMIMVELAEENDVLAEIHGFQWDSDYTVQLSDNRFLYRGTLQTEQAQKDIEQLPCFLSLLADSIIGPCTIPFVEPNFVIKCIEASARKEELETFLNFAEQNGKITTSYRKWVEKMTDGVPLPRPVYGKMVKEFGSKYEEPKG